MKNTEQLPLENEAQSTMENRSGGRGRGRKRKIKRQATTSYEQLGEVWLGGGEPSNQYSYHRGRTMFYFFKKIQSFKTFVQKGFEPFKK